MKLLLDEMLSPAIARELRARGHDVESVAGQPDRESLSDPQVLGLARAEHRAVVTNNLNKAYFLRENDPVFNGYVVKITGDSVVFQETMQDKLGKPFTREVVKRIATPAV